MNLRVEQIDSDVTTGKMAYYVTSPVRIANP